MSTPSSRTSFADFRRKFHADLRNPGPTHPALVGNTALAAARGAVKRTADAPVDPDAKTP